MAALSSTRPYRRGAPPSLPDEGRYVASEFKKIEAAIGGLGAPFVHYDVAQALTSPQQAQARANISAQLQSSVLSALSSNGSTTSDYFRIFNQYFVLCDTTGAAEASSHIQAAVNAAIAAGGGEVILPAGVILNNNGVTFDGGAVSIRGQGWEDYKGKFQQYTPAVHGTSGTYVLQTSPTYPCFLFAPNSDGCAVRYMAFIQQHAADTPGWTPTNYQPCILMSGPDQGSLLVEHVMFFGVNQGIQAGEVAQGIGRLIVQNCSLCCFSVGVSIVCAGDVVRITDCHFYSGFIQPNWNQMGYMVNNAKAILSLRNDNPRFTNNFIIGHKYGYFFDSTTDGWTSKFRIIGGEADLCWCGIFVAPAAGMVTGSIDNFVWQAYQGEFPGVSEVSGSTGIFVDGPSQIDAVSIRLSSANSNALRVDGAGSDFAVSNLFIENWNRAGTGWPGVEAANAASNVYISGRLRVSGGGGAPTTGGAGTVNHGFAY
jgi:hypothetical protein